MAKIPLPKPKPKRSEKSRPIGVMPNYAFNKTQFNDLDMYKDVEPYLDPVAKLGWHAYATGELELRTLEITEPETVLEGPVGEFIPAPNRYTSTKSSSLSSSEYNKEIRERVEEVDHLVTKYPEFKSKGIARTYATVGEGPKTKGSGISTLVHELRHAGLHYMLNNLNLKRSNTSLERYLTERSVGISPKDKHLGNMSMYEFPIGDDGEDEIFGRIHEEHFWDLIDNQFLPELAEKKGIPIDVKEMMASPRSHFAKTMSDYWEKSDELKETQKELFSIAQKHLDNFATLKKAKSKVEFKKGMERLGKTKTPNMILRERGVVEKVLDFLLKRDRDLYKGKSLDEQMEALKVG